MLALCFVCLALWAGVQGHELDENGWVISAGEGARGMGDFGTVFWTFASLVPP